MKRVLVTGGLGFIGSHTVVELVISDYEVFIIDNLSNSDISVLKGIEKIVKKKINFFPIDLRSKEEIALFFSENKIDGIIHFAASKAVGESVEKPLLYYENNIHTLVYVLQACVKHQINNFIFSSSCTVYGEPDSLPISEEAPIKPALSPYGNTKQINEEIIRDTCLANKKLQAISLRYFNPIGAHETAEIGELPKGVPQNLVPFITQTAAGLREQLSIFGNDYPTPDGTNIRDYIHVVDLAKAHVTSIDHLFKNKNTTNYTIYNLGTGKGSSVLEVVDTFEKVNNLKLNYKITDRRPGDVVSVYANSQKANTELNWKAQKSLEEALKSAWNWEKKVRNIKG